MHPARNNDAQHNRHHRMKLRDDLRACRKKNRARRGTNERLDDVVDVVEGWNFVGEGFDDQQDGDHRQ